MENDLSELFDDERKVFEGAEAAGNGNLITVKDNRVFAWLPHVNRLVTAGCVNWNARKSTFTYGLTTVLSFCSLPSEEVLQLKLDSSGLHLALVTKTQVVVVFVPPCIFFSADQTDCQGTQYCRSRSLAMVVGEGISNDFRILCARWYASAKNDCRLAVLGNDNLFRYWL
ncbi:unnamed protein product [Soboliphyme baturini]|uniref:Anaphase-promoting complex subunit 1 n=1 Tax=Soboliphyme baturini TaxID=241478 RepID=A0A183IKK8_9BILA|nr:unnamed protein product [Soboliphyme baturini]